MHGATRVLGMDIGGTNIRAGLVNPTCGLEEFTMSSSVRLFSSSAGPAEVLRDFVREYCAEKLGGGMPAAVSIGFPSTINKAKDSILSTPNLAHFNNVNIVQPLQQWLGVPVFINRDVNLLLLNDIHEHKLAGDVIIGCYVGTGLGNSIYIGGEMLDGKNGVAGELGHIPVLGESRVCGCGNLGCMETIASGRRLEEINNTHFAGESIREIFTLHAGHEEVQKFVQGLAVPVATEVNIFDPDYVVLGGGVLQMPGFPYESLLEHIHTFSRKPYPDENLCIVRSTGKQESGVVGAGMYAFRKLGTRPLAAAADFG